MEVKDIFIWLGIFIVGSLIVTFLISPNSFQSFKSNMKSIIPENENAEILNSNEINFDNTTNPNSQGKVVSYSEESKCKSEYNKYSKIGEDKWSVNFNFNLIEKIQDKEELREFFAIYGSAGEYMMFKSFEESSVYPMYAIATSVFIPNVQMSVPKVIVCDTNGDLTELSKTKLVNP